MSAPSATTTWATAGSWPWEPGDVRSHRSEVAPRSWGTSEESPVRLLSGDMWSQPEGTSLLHGDVLTPGYCITSVLATAQGGLQVSTSTRIHGWERHSSLRAQVAHSESWACAPKLHWCSAPPGLPHSSPHRAASCFVPRSGTRGTSGDKGRTRLRTSSLRTAVRQSTW